MTLIMNFNIRITLWSENVKVPVLKITDTNAKTNGQI